MRDPMNWAIPVFRAFGIPVRVHIFFFVITIGLFLRQVLQPGNPIWWGDVFLFTIVLLFGVVLMHEFGHCFGGRSVGGEATEVLIWPLGGLAFVDVPHNPRAHLITVAAGPAVNVVLCVLCTVILAGAGFLPNLNPIADPYVSEVRNYRQGIDYTSEYGFNYYKPGTNEQKATTSFDRELRRAALPKEFTEQLTAALTPQGYERALAPLWVVWVNRIFWLNWVLLLFNLLPAFPLDGGQLLQGAIWHRTGNYRQGTIVAAYSGYVVSLLFLLASIAFNEALLMGLSLFMFYSSAMKLHAMQNEEGLYGDFSQGYLSLERDDPPPRPRRQNFFKRWLQARAARRMQRESEQQMHDEDRFDRLLEKIHAHGKDSLTEEEQRFMKRHSERYKNK